MSGPIRIDRHGRPQLPHLDLRRIVGAVLVVGLGLGIVTSYYQVDLDSVAVIRRLGKYIAPPREPGLHWRLPFGIDRVTLVPVQVKSKEEFGFRTELAGVITTYEPDAGYMTESLMLTGDLNMVVVKFSVQYKISSAPDYLFKVKHPEATLRYMAQALMREVVGDRTVNEVLTVGRSELSSVVEERLQELCKQYEIGFEIDEVILQDIAPPDEVRASFDGVNQAQQLREKRINEARSEYNREVPKAEGQASQTVEQARGYAIDRTNRAEGDSNRFTAFAAEYRKAPEVTRRRIYLETMRDILPRAGRKVIVEERAGNLLQLLDLNPGAKPVVTEAK